MSERMSEEETENLARLIELLMEADEQQKTMTEEEKRDNAIKMHTDKGDIYY